MFSFQSTACALYIYEEASQEVERYLFINRYKRQSDPPSPRRWEENDGERKCLSSKAPVGRRGANRRRGGRVRLETARRG